MITNILSNKNNNNVKILKWDWLLIIGLVLAPMTGLRVWKVGPGELLCFIWGIKYVSKDTFKPSATIIFFVGFITSMLIGGLFAQINYSAETDLVDITTWLFFAYLTLVMYSALKKKKLDYIQKMFLLFAYLSVSWYLFLYLYSLKVSKSFFDAPLWFVGVRFTGGATNPHQLACMLCGLIMLFCYNVIYYKKLIINVIYIAISVFLLSQTESSTGYLAIVLSAIVFLLVIPFRLVPQKKNVILVVEVMTILGTALLLYQQIFQFFMEWVSSDVNGLGRLDIYSTIWDALKKSFLFGLGPGTHAQNGIREFHNTYLEILASSGVVGFSCFIAYTIYLFKKCKNNILMLPIIIAMYAYGLAGYAMRRLVYWGIIMFVLVISEKTEEGAK